MTQTRSLAVLLTAKAISDIGFALDFVCLGVFVWVRTESALATGLLGLSVYAGGMLGGRLGHRYGADWNRRRAMVGADLARMAVLVLLAVLPSGAQLWWLFPAMVVVGAGRSVFETTLSAATPVLAGERLQAVNSVVSAVKGIALVVGMGLATIAVPLVGFRGVFALDAASYGLSAAVLLALRLRLREAPVPDRPAGDVRVGWPVLLAAGLVALLVVRGLDALGSASHHVGLPILGDQRDPGNPAGVAGVVWMVWAAGMLAGALLLRPLLAGAIRRSPQFVFFVATALMSAGFIGVFWLSAWPAVVGAGVLAGLGDALSEVTYKESMQRLPDRQRGPAFGLSMTVINAGFVIGLVVAGLALAPELLAEWILVMHGIPLLAAVGAAAWVAYRGFSRTTDGSANRVEVGKDL
jgi:predicted MFS family arabinose efflux permease